MSSQTRIGAREHEEKSTGSHGQMQDRVLAALQYGLMSGVFVPGQVMSLRKLAASLGTSAMPVRDSLSRLLAANALEELPNRSLRVPRMTGRNLAELFEIRVRIEGLAARIAAQSSTPEFLEELSGLNRDLQKAHSAGDMAEVLRKNQEFHFLIYRVANSDILMPLIEALWLRSGPTMYFSLNSAALWDTSFHIELLDAFTKKDGDAAEYAMARDIKKTGDYLVEQAAIPRASGPLATLPRINPQLHDMDLRMQAPKA